MATYGYEGEGKPFDWQACESLGTKSFITPTSLLHTRKLTTASWISPNCPKCALNSSSPRSPYA